MSRRHFVRQIATLGLATLGSASLRAAPAEPLIDARWADTRRQRELPLRLRLPSGSGPVPLVLFSHGLGGTVDAGTLWAQAWAAAGIATLHLQHPGSDADAMRGGRLLQAISGQQLVNRALDVRFVLDELQRQREGPWARLRLDAIGLAGHSFGALTTLAVAGRSFEAVQRARREPATPDTLEDPRPLAFAAFSPSPGNPRLGPDGLAAIRRPMLCLTGTLDGDPLGDERTGTYRRQVYDHLPPGQKAELWLDGADHMTFGGSPRGEAQGEGRGALLGRQRETAPVAQASRHQALIAQTSTLWWQAHLLNLPAARQQLSTGPTGLLPADEWRRG